MNGIHDMGGMHGFGRIERELNEPVFHEPWERRVFGLTAADLAAIRLPCALSQNHRRGITPKLPVMSSSILLSTTQ